jgi:ParB family transcriptional regulator, chromosome partitioning protein
MTRKPISLEANPLFAGPSLEARNRMGSPFRYIQLSEIDVDPDQPRRVFNSEGLDELAASIKEFGVLCPILVRVTAGGTYRLVSGERRFRACKQLGLENIPAVIDQDDPEGTETLGKQLVENLQREDLSPMERALAIGQLRGKCSMSVRDIAGHLGLSKSLIQRSLEILTLPDDLQAALIAGASESKILMLGQVEDRGIRKRILSDLDNLTRTQLEAAINEANGSQREQSKASHGGTVEGSGEKLTLSVEDQRVVDEIQRSLGTKVQLLRTAKKPKQGRLVIDFYSSEDLDEIYRRLVNLSRD